MSDIAAVGEKRVFEPFDKEAFKKEILNNIKYLFRKTPETASQQKIFQAVAYASKDMIIDEWLNAHKESGLISIPLCSLIYLARRCLF